MKVVYLIHIDEPVGRIQTDETREQHGHGPRIRQYQPHAQHYIGWTVNLDARVREHKSGHGAGLLRAATDQGLAWSVVRTWPGDWRLEKKLKARKESPSLCPICNPKSWMKNAQEK